jgi:hypothetical protein
MVSQRCHAGAIRWAARRRLEPGGVPRGPQARAGVRSGSNDANDANVRAVIRADEPGSAASRLSVASSRPMRTNVHVHLFSADHTPQRQLYFLLRGAIHTAARAAFANFLGRSVSAQELQSLDLSLDRYAAPWPQLFPWLAKDGLVDPKKMLDMLTTISRLPREDGRRIFGLGASEAAGDMVVGLEARLAEKQGRGSLTPFRDAMCDLVAELFAAHEAEVAGKGRMQTSEIWGAFQRTPGAEIFDRVVALSVNFDEAFKIDGLPGLSADPKVDFDKQKAELAALAGQVNGAGGPTIVPFLGIDYRGYSSRELLQMVVDEVGPGKTWKGLKLYPPMGLSPADPPFFPLYERCMELGIPLLSHCSVGGAGVRGSTVNYGDLARPKLWQPALDQLEAKWVRGGPTFKLCLAHFDGLYEDANVSWSQELISMLQHYDGSRGVELYADIAFTTVSDPKSRANYTANVNKVKQMGLAKRVLFGSDWWMYLYSEENEKTYLDQLDIDKGWWDWQDMDEGADNFLRDVP